MLINDPLVMFSNQALQNYRGREGVRARPFVQVAINPKSVFIPIGVVGVWLEKQAREKSAMCSNKRSVQMSQLVPIFTAHIFLESFFLPG